MLETIISSTNGDSFTLINALIVMGAAIIFGLVISITYMKSHKKEGYNPSFATTLIMLPAIISIIILLVGNNVARAFSLAGAFSIIRYRSAPREPRDIAFVFFTLAVGLACGMGYIGYGAVVTVVLCLVMIVLSLINYGSPSAKSMMLKITVPEDLNFEGVFDEILDEYTMSWKYEKIKTRDFGSLFELSYRVTLDDKINRKEFIDKLRTRNGNLNITLTSYNIDEKVYA